MADALVRELNRLGYQPVFLPRTNVLPPELYAYSEQRLVRHGPLKDYLKSSPALQLTNGQLGDIAYKYTSSKKVDGSLSFLENALKCIGISGAPRLNLQFAGAHDFSFAFSNVTYQSLDPATLKNLIPEFVTAGIPQKYLDDGLHIAYEYAYANELLMSRGDKQDFSTNISASVSQYLDIGAQGAVSVASQSTISFKSTAGASAAFAYKAGKLTREGRHWVFDPEVVSRKGFEAVKKAYVPQPAIVLMVADPPSGT